MVWTSVSFTPKFTKITSKTFTKLFIVSGSFLSFPFPLNPFMGLLFHSMYIWCGLHARLQYNNWINLMLTIVVNWHAVLIHWCSWVIEFVPKYGFQQIPWLETTLYSKQYIHKDRILWKNLIENKEIVLKNGVKNIQTTGYNGARTVVRFLHCTNTVKFYFHLLFTKQWSRIWQILKKI